MTGNFHIFYSITRKLKLSKRQGWLERDLKADSISDHIYGAMTIGWKMALEESVDQHKVVELLLVHDWVMSVIPDVTPKNGRYGEKDELEEKGKAKVTDILGQKIGKYYLDLFEEFKELKTPESRVARESDKLDTLMQGDSFEEETGRNDILDEFLETYGPIFTTKAGRRIFNEIQSRHQNRKKRQMLA